MTLSLWLMPDGPVHERFATLIRSLAQRFAAPVFEPHVTLLGGLRGPADTLLTTCRVLAGELRPFQVRLERADHGDELFRCLFVVAHPTQELIAAHARAAQLFGKADVAPYLPHLSLLYAHLTLETKEALLAEIGRRFDSEFEVRALDVFATDGDPSSWRRLERIALGPPAEGARSVEGSRQR